MSVISQQNWEKKDSEWLKKRNLIMDNQKY